ncbi:hypothetical protein [Sulfurimonas sp.]|uniref:hypothetical protein n=1 Tax=Sulfurimonas sp. TaxID=2022749 RepID=UPI003566E25F
MQAKISYIFLISIAILFSGCLNKKPSVKKVQTPTWVKTMPKDNTKFTYGVGISKTREDALKEALNDVVSKFGVKVKSSFTNKEIVDGYYSKSISSSNIEASVEKIKVTNYNVEKSARISYKEYAVLIKVDNEKFFNTLLKDITQLEKYIESELEKTAAVDIISRYNINKAMLKECDRLLSNSLVAYELNNNFEKNRYFNFVSDVKENYYNVASSLRFYVYGDKNSQNFLKVIKQQLIDSGFNVADKNNVNVINVKLSTSDNHSSKQQIVSIKLNMRVTDGLVTLGSRSFVLKERYKNSKESIYNTASVHFEQDVEKNTIENILGIGINN